MSTFTNEVNRKYWNKSITNAWKMVRQYRLTEYMGRSVDELCA